MKFAVKTGDTVKIISGKERGKTGKVVQTFPKLGRIVVEGMNTSKRHLRARRSGEKGQVVEFSMPVHASNVMIVGEDGKARRHSQRHLQGKKQAVKHTDAPAKQKDAKADVASKK
ncbi:50S ribosomal protein L24 [Candidatus Uhrbacteria bacterium]|nr:50S ribosomal protein L24 [Candidatus Uhrbacteria bacterium]MBD3284399.1 50S ribosomal protein L24 [Candidatus Uhrbacteria bacterium]